MTSRTRFASIRVPVAILVAALLLTPLAGRPADATSPGVDVVYIADGRSFADALVGAALAGANNTSVLTVAGTNNGDTVPQATKDELTRLQPVKIIILGGLAAVSQAVEDELGGYTEPTPGNTERLAGSDRYATAAAISAAMPDAVKRALSADDADTLDGKNSTDFALSGQACTAGKVVTAIAANGTPVCATDAIDGGDAETLDGMDSTAFVTRQQPVQMWFDSGGAQVQESDGQSSTDLATVTLELPAEPSCEAQGTRHLLFVQLTAGANAGFDSQAERERVWFRFHTANGFSTPIRMTLVPSDDAFNVAEASGAAQFESTALAGSRTYRVAAVVLDNTDSTSVSAAMTIWHRGFECV